MAPLHVADYPSLALILFARLAEVLIIPVLFGGTDGRWSGLLTGIAFFAISAILALRRRGLSSRKDSPEEMFPTSSP